MKRVKCLVAILIMTIIVTPVFGHSGRTDSSGGHKDNKNKSGLGSYHYHCGGYPAHLHDNGICPYAGGAATEIVITPTPVPTHIPTPTPIPTPVPTPAPIIKVTIDGSVVEFDQPPLMINGSVMVPVRFVAEQMGCEVNWYSDVQTITMFSAGQKESVFLKGKYKLSDNINIYLNNELVDLDGKNAEIVNGRTLIPIRPIAEKLNYAVDWDSSSYCVTIKSNGDAVANINTITDADSMPVDEPQQSPVAQIPFPDIDVQLSESAIKEYLQTHYPTVTAGGTEYQIEFTVIETVTNLYNVHANINASLSARLHTSKEETLTEIKPNMERIALDLMQRFPNVKFKGDYIHSFYRYPTIRVDYVSYSYCNWTNFEYSGYYIDNPAEREIHWNTEFDD